MSEENVEQFHRINKELSARRTLSPDFLAAEVEMGESARRG